MHLKTALNHVYRHPGFIYSGFKLTGVSRPTLHVTVKPHRGSKATCSACTRKAPGYDMPEDRCFELIPLWGIVVFSYAMRRVACPRCGVKVETVPWATGRSSLTKAYAYFHAARAKRMSWSEVADAFHTSWESVFRSVKRVVEWGLAHRCLLSIMRLGDLPDPADQSTHRFC